MVGDGKASLFRSHGKKSSLWDLLEEVVKVGFPRAWSWHLIREPRNVCAEIFGSAHTARLRYMTYLGIVQ